MVGVLVLETLDLVLTLLNQYYLVDLEEYFPQLRRVQVLLPPMIFGEHSTYRTDEWPMQTRRVERVRASLDCDGQHEDSHEDGDVGPHGGGSGAAVASDRGKDNIDT